MDWREVGQQVFDYLKAQRTEGCKQQAANLKRVRGKPPSANVELCHALVVSAHGDTDLLVEFLLSARDFSLSKKDRDWLARVLRHKNWAPRLGRPADRTARFVFSYAQQVYLLWKHANKEMGISDWGLRDQMKDEACRYAVDLTGPYPKGREPNFETVRQLLERSKKRQTYRTKPAPKRRQNRRRVSA